MKKTLKLITPAPIWRASSDLYWAWRNRGRHVMTRLFSARWSHSRQRLAIEQDQHLGQRCFIIGNGPSLRQTDLSKLRNEVTFGLNRIYMLFPELGFSTTYLVSVNDLVLEQCAAEIQALNLPRYITWRARQWFRLDPNLIYLDTDFTGEENFSTNCLGRVFEGFTVTFVALQLAFHMGFKEAILVGVDHNFTTQGPANQAVISQGDDPNHFSASYFGKGFKWQLPDLPGSERAYILARDAYAQAGRQVLDATVGGKLTVFPKVEYDTIFEKI